MALMGQKKYGNRMMSEIFLKIMREEMADVQFIFELNGDNSNGNDVNEPPAAKIARTCQKSESSGSNSDRIVKIPAHKKVLAASSPVFDAMFNDLLKENGDVKIGDISANAFREFLQIF